MDSSDDEPNLYLRNECNISQTEEVNDKWDDSNLVKAYDKAVNKAKEQIVRKLKEELNLDEEDVKHILGDNVTLDESPKHEKKKNAKFTEFSNSKTLWRVGDACRCIYSEDGEEYEAKITSMVDKKSCRVKYIGYGNVEVVSLKDLAPSSGKSAVRAQKKTAAISCTGSKEEGKISSDHEKMEEPLPEKESQSHPRSFSFPQRVPMFSNGMPQPPIPPMPSFSSFNDFNSMGAGTFNHSSKSEHFDAMLLSWFMCGYYTGHCAAEQKYREENAS